MAAVLLAASAGLHWWHTTDAPEPIYALCCRSLMAMLAISAIFAFFVPSVRTQVLVIAGYAALLTPCLLILSIATMDSKGVSHAVVETTQAYRLIRFTQYLDINPGIPWTEEREVLAMSVVRDDYTLTDALESVLHYTVGGWYLAVVAGLVLIIAAWAGDVTAVKTFLVRWRVLLFAAPAAYILFAFTGPMLGYLYYTRGVDAQSRGNNPIALADLATAKRWDPRLAYDDGYNFDLGRIYAADGDTDRPEYWAFVGDVYLNSGNADRGLGYAAYAHIPLTCSNPSVRVRYANDLLRKGADEYEGGDIGSAAETWNAGLMLDPTDLELRYAVALAYTEERNYPLAVSTWLSLIKSNDGVGLYRLRFVTSYTFRNVISAHAWANIAWCCYQEGDLARATVAKEHSLGGSVAAANRNLFE